MKKHLVLLHGYGFDSSIWNPVLPFLTQHFSIHTPDLPGFGSRHDVIFSDQIQEVRDQLLEACPDRAIYVGWSLGGVLASSIAQHASKKITHLITVNSNAKFIASSDWPGVETTTFNTFKNNTAANPKRSLRKFYHSITPKHHLSNTIKKQLRHYINLEKKPQTQSLMNALSILERSDSRTILKSISIPQTHLIGTPDELFPHEAIKQHRTQLPHSDIILMEQGGHMPFLTDPERFAHHVYDKTKNS